LSEVERNRIVEEVLRQKYGERAEDVIEQAKTMKITDEYRAGVEEVPEPELYELYEGNYLDRAAEFLGLPHLGKIKEYETLEERPKPKPKVTKVRPTRRVKVTTPFRPISPITKKDLGNPIEFLMPEITGLTRPIAIPKTMEIYYDDDAKVFFERKDNALIEISLASLLRKIMRERKRIEELAKPLAPPPVEAVPPTIPPVIQRFLERISEFIEPMPEYRESYLYRDEYGHEWYSYTPDLEECPFRIEKIDPKTGLKTSAPCPGKPKVIRTWSQKYDPKTGRYYPIR
jgi:hypothetical protein